MQFHSHPQQKLHFLCVTSCDTRHGSRAVRADLLYGILTINVEGVGRTPSLSQVKFYFPLEYQILSRRDENIQVEVHTCI